MRRLGGAAAAAGVLLVLTGCGSQAPAPSASPTVTVVESPSASPSTSEAAPSPSPSPSASATVTATATPDDTSGGTQAQDPNRPSGQCPNDSVAVAIAMADGGGGAGNEYYDVLFTNIGGSSCVLRGTPGVSVVGRGSGTQLGPAADRVESGVKTVRLGVGESVAAPLKVVNIGTNGGPLPNCSVVHGDGYRVYPPHSKRAYFVQDSKAVACSGGQVFMTVSPVIPYTG